MAAKIWAIGAGKGGVGKSFLTANLGITISKLNFSVLVIDLDLSGANLHTHLGIAPSSPSIQSFFSNESTLATLIKATQIPRLSFIQGVWEEWEHASCSRAACKKLVEEARRLPFDFVLLDLGPGYTKTNLDIFNYADEKILVASAEPTSTEKTYRFLESWILHKAAQDATPQAFEDLRKSLKHFRHQKKEEFFSFREYLQEAAGFTPDRFAEMNMRPLRLIVNGARSHHDQELGFAVKSVCKKYFDLPMDYLGALDFDNAVWHSVRNCEPFLIAKPFTALSGQLLSLSKALLETEIDATLYRSVV